MVSLKKKAVNGVKYTTISTVLRSILQILQLIILARYLNANDFGLVAIVMVIIGFSQIFMDMGISNAIIHKQIISSIQLSSLYWLNLLSGTILTVIIFLIAPLISTFYNEDKITPLLQILSISFFINSIGNQYRVLLKKELKFNLLAKIEIIAAIGMFITAVIFAINNFGAYSLVFASIVNVSISSSFVFFYGIRRHKPSFVYVHKDIKGFLSFGIYQVAQNSIVYFTQQFDVILIGKLLGTETLGLYNLIKQLVMRPSNIMKQIITSVSFPIMSKVQEDINKLKIIYLRIISYISLINAPLYSFMFVLAPELILILLGNSWLNNDSIIIFRILAVYALVRSTMSPAGPLLLSKGRADIGFYWSLAELLLIPTSIIIGSKGGIIGITISLLLYQLLLSLANYYLIIKRILIINIFEYYKTQLIPIFSSVIIVFFINMILYWFNIESNIIYLVVWFISTAILYSFSLYYYNKELLFEIISIIRNK